MRVQAKGDSMMYSERTLFETPREKLKSDIKDIGWIPDGITWGGNGIEYVGASLDSILKFIDQHEEAIKDYYFFKNSKDESTGKRR